jgi:hypothetical protein
MVYVAASLESGLKGDALIDGLPELLRNRLQISWERIEPGMPQPDQLNAVANLMLEA